MSLSLLPVPGSQARAAYRSPCAEAISESALAASRDNYHDYHGRYLLFDHPSESLSQRIETPQMQEALFQLRHPGIRHYLPAKAAAIGAVASKDFLSAGIFYAHASHLSRKEYPEEYFRSSLAAAHSFLIVGEEIQDEQTLRLAAEYFNQAGYHQSAAKVYWQLGGADAATRSLGQLFDHFRSGATRTPAPPNPEPQDPFKVLGVSRTASKEEIRKAFRKKVLLLHPDTAGQAYNERSLFELLDAKEFLEKHGFL